MQTLADGCRVVSPSELVLVHLAAATGRCCDGDAAVGRRGGGYLVQTEAVVDCLRLLLGRHPLPHLGRQTMATVSGCQSQVAQTA